MAPRFQNSGVPRSARPCRPSPLFKREAANIGLSQHRKLQDQHRGARGRDGKKGLPNPRQEIDFVTHVSAPLTETDRTADTMRPCPIHNKRSS